MTNSLLSAPKVRSIPAWGNAPGNPDRITKYNCFYSFVPIRLSKSSYSQRTEELLTGEWGQSNEQNGIISGARGSSPLPIIGRASSSETLKSNDRLQPAPNLTNKPSERNAGHPDWDERDTLARARSA